MYSREAMFPKEMWRFLAPYLTVAAAIAIAAGVAYGSGAPVWSVYLGGVVAVAVVLPGYERWESRRPPR